MTAKRQKDEVHGRAELKPAPKIRLVNGRVVGKSIADPDVQIEVKKLQTSLREDVANLTKFYVDQGILTRTGKLAKRFGG